jgi:hypothetical protein
MRLELDHQERHSRNSLHLFTLEWVKIFKEETQTKRRFSCEQAIKASKIVLINHHWATIIWILCNSFLHQIWSSENLGSEWMWASHEFRLLKFIFWKQQIAVVGKFDHWLWVFIYAKWIVCWMILSHFFFIALPRAQKLSPFFVYHVYQWALCWCKTISNAVLFDARRAVQCNNERLT